MNSAFDRNCEASLYGTSDEDSCDNNNKIVINILDDYKSQVIIENHSSLVKSSQLQSETQLDRDDNTVNTKPPPISENEKEQSGVSFDSKSASVKDTTGNNENAEHLLESINTKNIRIPKKLPIQTKISNSLLQDEETYELEKFEKNVMIIFNHEFFLGRERRLGTDLDVAALENTFKQFRFDVTTCDDLTKQDLFDELERFSKINFNAYGCICVAILTHGQDGGFLRAYDTRYREREVFSCFDALANPTLVAKPIIFLIQACRGPTTAAGVPSGCDQNVEFDADSLEIGSRPTESDMIIFHSSFFGRASVRVKGAGTWFIQTICNQMTRHGSTYHLEKLFLKVRQNVAAMEHHGIKQMPTVTSTLLKKLYLKKIDDAKITLKCESNCRDDTYQPIDLNLGCAIAHNGGSTADDTYNGGSTSGDTYKEHRNVAAMEHHGIKQTPTDTSTLLKKLYLQQIDDIKIIVESESNCKESRVSRTVRERQYRVGLNLFNKEPERGIDYLISNGFLHNSARGVAVFLIKTEGLSKQMIGEYLSNLQNEFSMIVLECFLHELDLSGMAVDVALRRFLAHFRLPDDAHKVERLVKAFATHYCVLTTDFALKLRMRATMLLAFNIIMLNTNLHTLNLKPEPRISLDDFLHIFRGIDDCGDINRDMLVGIYERVESSELRPDSDHVTKVMRVEAAIMGKKPHLALPHRSLVCCERLVEIPDIHKNERPGIHRRLVLLFNDLLVITKYDKEDEKRTYTFQRSFPLCGMMVNLFSVPHYPFGIRLSRRVDGRRLAKFSFYSDICRGIFVHDLRKNVAVMEETMRVEGELNREKGREGDNN